MIAHRVAGLALMAAIGLAAPARADVDSAVKAVNALPGVVNSSPDSAGNLWVMVAPRAGVQWSQYAASVCLVVLPHHARIFLVKIIDVTSVHSKIPKDWRMIGAASCGG